MGGGVFNATYCVCGVDIEVYGTLNAVFVNKGSQGCFYNKLLVFVSTL